jgi:hypothetical protein
VGVSCINIGEISNLADVFSNKKRTPQYFGKKM